MHRGAPDLRRDDAQVHLQPAVGHGSRTWSSPLREHARPPTGGDERLHDRAARRRRPPGCRRRRSSPPSAEASPRTPRDVTCGSADSSPTSASATSIATLDLTRPPERPAAARCPGGCSPRSSRRTLQRRDRVLLRSPRRARRRRRRRAPGRAPSPSSARGPGSTIMLADARRDLRPELVEPANVPVEQALLDLLGDRLPTFGILQIPFMSKPAMSAWIAADRARRLLVGAGLVRIVRRGSTAGPRTR